MENRTSAEELRRSAFHRNNRIVLQTINVMREDYTPLESVADALENTIGLSDVTDCVNYLTESGYIKLRIRGTQTTVTDLADAEFSKLSAKLTAKGIQLLNGKIKDPCIRE